MMKRLAGLLAAVLMLTACFVVPVRASGDSYDPDHPERLRDSDITAAAAILIDAGSGRVVYQKNADEKMYPASTTKILTVYLGILLGDMDATVTASEQALKVKEGASLIPLSPGEEISFRDLLYATMIRSGNDGANVIAETVSGSVEGFVALMNQYADSLGLTATHFTNPSGLHDREHYTSARDLAFITREAMRNELFRDIVRQTSYTLPADNLRPARVLTSRLSEFMTDTESKDYYPYAIGVKTGNTSAAGHCFAGAAEKDGITLISVVLHCSGENTYRYCWQDTRRLMEYGFSVCKLFRIRAEIND